MLLTQQPFPFGSQEQRNWQTAGIFNSTDETNELLLQNQSQWAIEEITFSPQHGVAPYLKPRAILTRKRAIEIFQQSSPANSNHDLARKPSALLIARQFRISENTVRVIWKGRTWNIETHHLDSHRKARGSRQNSRPLGRRGSKPRRPRRDTARGANASAPARWDRRRSAAIPREGPAAMAAAAATTHAITTAAAHAPRRIQDYIML